MPPKTMFQKIWGAHVVHEEAGEPTLLYVDLHLVHEVTSPQAFDGLRLAGRKVRRTDLTVATADHNTPTWARSKPITDPLAKQQLDALARNCEEFGITLYDMYSPNQGIVHIIGPEQGYTQPGKLIVCGDSHTSTHGAFGAIALGIGTTQVELVLATQCMVQARMKTMEVRVNGPLPSGVTPKDLILGIIGQIGIDGATGHAVEYTGEALRAMSIEGRMTVCNMSIEAGARAGMVAPDDTTFDYMRGRPQVPQGDEFEAAVDEWRHLATDPGATFDTLVEIDATSLEPFVTWGTNPGMVVPVTGRVPNPASFHDPSERAAAERALEYMALDPDTPVQDIKIDRGLPRLLHERPYGGPDGRRCGGERAQGERQRVRDGGAGLQRGEEAGRGRRAGPRIQRGRLRLAGGRLLDVPGHESRHPAARRALCVDVQPQLRGSPGQGRAYPPGQPADGRRRRHRRPLRRHKGVVVSDEIWAVQISTSRDCQVPKGVPPDFSVPCWCPAWSGR